MPTNKILKGEDLSEIASWLIENGYSDANLKIVIRVKDKQTLKNINDDYFYRFDHYPLNEGEKNNENTNRDAEEIVVNIGGIDFQYVVDENS